MEDPVRESIKQVDENTWLIGALILHRSSGYSDTATWYDRGDDLIYILTDAPDPAPPFVPLPPNHPNIVLVYDVGNRSAVWSLGNSTFCKVKVRVNDTTREATTLGFVQKQQPGFDTPNILHQAEHDGRSYLFLSRVPGRTLANAWPTLDEKWKHHYVNAVVKICETRVLERRYDWGRGWKVRTRAVSHQVRADYNYHAGNLRQACESMGMDCSEFVFYHADLGPGNIIVENIPDTGSVGIIDWETAGYFPRGWIRTKFRTSSGLDLPGSVEEEHWWRGEVQESLGVRGFEDFSKEWERWWY
ncbi:unnamed protein product [Penicillium salamii]|uniref:Aminoglycoside phosphotransferase domain-containing protein n=1 Tax=Penicillium salamii TaxID=1612424 RepID=A0A9W4JYZ4_9EURO|nr:unnamed protein product [Penicillium salamii]CAG8222341.1 unnamed protein product [Penicillium salamii]CAG8285654.1 unnamed protein product [Penicillium salamii]CAG8392848.1 unnamed protein product [Penicillium salamii]CAG8417934.1 unnamed protein product [Penicillium salamii]